MVQSHVVSAIFLILVSANVIQGGVIPSPLLQEEFFPNFVDLVGLPRIGELSHNVASSAATAASHAYNGFRTYLDNFRTGFGERIQIPPRFALLNRFVNQGFLPGLTDPAIVGGATDVVPTGVVPTSGHLVAPGLLSNYRGRLGGGATSAGAASAASG
ncbi:hypothetical protein P5V15_001681 [Pogonomyrmex californicus]